MVEASWKRLGFVSKAQVGHPLTPLETPSLILYT